MKIQIRAKILAMARYREMGDRMGKGVIIRIFAAIGFYGLVGIAMADFSLLRPIGNEWVYQGSGLGEPTIGYPDTTFSIPRLIRYKDRLQLKVTGYSQKGDTTIYTVRESDSLFSRKLEVRNSNNVLVALNDLSDTVVVRNLVYKERLGKIKLVEGDSLYFGHMDSTDLFFFAHATVPMSAGPIPNLPQPYSGLHASFNQYPLQILGEAWYLNDVGLYWAKMQTYCKSQCGCMGNRELLLTSFNGKIIDPGIDPPGLGLAKEGRITCGTAKSRRQRKGPAQYLRHSRGLNALGRLQK